MGFYCTGSSWFPSFLLQSQSQSEDVHWLWTVAADVCYCNCTNHTLAQSCWPLLCSKQVTWCFMPSQPVSNCAAGVRWSTTIMCQMINNNHVSDDQQQSCVSWSITIMCQLINNNHVSDDQQQSCVSWSTTIMYQMINNNHVSVDQDSNNNHMQILYIYMCICTQAEHNNT